MTLQNSQGGSEGSNPFGATGPLTSGNVREGAGFSRLGSRICRQIVVISAAAVLVTGAPAFADETPAPSPSVSAEPTSSPTPSISPSTQAPAPVDAPEPSTTATAAPTPAPSATTAAPLIVLADKALPGGMRLVTADTTAVVNTSPAAKRGAMFAVRFTCDGRDIGATQNVPKGGTLTMRPRLLLDARRCTLYGRPEMPARQSGSIRSSGVVAGAMGYTPTVWPNVITPGRSYDYLPAEWAVPARVRTVTVTGDQKATACTSWGGSRDNGSPYMCEGRVNPVGSLVRFQVWAQQRNVSGGFCVTRVVSSRDVRITPAVHHYMSYKQGTFTLSTAKGCTRSVRVKVRATLLSGSDLVLHRPGSATTVFAPV